MCAIVMAEHEHASFVAAGPCVQGAMRTAANTRGEGPLLQAAPDTAFHACVACLLLPQHRACMQPWTSP